MKTITAIAAAFLLAVSCAGPSCAEDATHDHHGHGAAATAPSSAAFGEVNARMHRDMAIEYSGNADVDFVRGMIPHHQGAIDMARVVLEHGADPELKRLAEDIIQAQEKEIAFMRAWLEKKAN
jgi:uncharacterized protein (DUF305 family)